MPADDGRLADQYCRTRSLLDIQGNEHEVRDALGRAVMRYGYTMLGAGDPGRHGHRRRPCCCPTSTGKPVYSRNSRGFTFRTDYDALRRPVRSYVAGPGITGQALQTADRVRRGPARRRGRGTCAPGSPGSYDGAGDR